MSAGHERTPGPCAKTSVSAASAAVPASLGRRLGALFYEALLLSALAIVVGFAFLPLISPVAPGDASLLIPSVFARTLLFCALAGGAALYYGWSWSDGRRTLPQKTWRLRIVARDGRSVTRRMALVRYAAVWIGPALSWAVYLPMRGHPGASSALVLFTVNVVWALIDRDGQFLHDRIAGTRVVFQR